MSDSEFRLTTFIGVLVLMSALEAIFPRRQRTQTRAQRWPTNLSIIIINSLALRLLGPISALIAADYALDNSWGLLALSPLPLPLWLEFIIGFLLLDLAIYWQHVASHKIALLWRFHRIHHADRDIDASTGIRFHPIEVAFSMIYKCLVIIALGPITIAVFAFEVILNASAMFNHANVKLPLKLDRLLRLVVVTPDVHRVHHSVIPNETNSNYGFFVIFWDRLFGTYIEQPKEGHIDMTIGLSEYQSNKPSSFSWVIFNPFR